MTVLSVVQAACHVGIDVKTLHRWLADAQLSLQPHPHDGRKKGVSLHDLQSLARLHQRSLPPFLQEPAASSVKGEGPPLPAEVLALPEQLSALQSQLLAVQQQLADLTRLLTQHESASVRPVAAVKPSRNVARQASPIPAVSRSPQSAKPPAKPVHVIARVEYGSDGQYIIICPKRGLLPIRPDTQEWFAWVTEQSSFRFVGKGGHFTAHHSWLVPKGAWRAHRQIRNHSYTLRLAPNHELTSAVLEQAALTLQAHLS